MRDSIPAPRGSRRGQTPGAAPRTQFLNLPGEGGLTGPLLRQTSGFMGLKARLGAFVGLGSPRPSRWDSEESQPHSPLCGSQPLAHSSPHLPPEDLEHLGASGSIWELTQRIEGGLLGHGGKGGGCVAEARAGSDVFPEHPSRQHRTSPGDLGTCITVNLHAFGISYYRSQHPGAGRALETFLMALKKSFYEHIKIIFLHATFNKHKIPDVLSKIKLTSPTSVTSRLLGEVAFGEKHRLSRTFPQRASYEVVCRSDVECNKGRYLWGADHAASAVLFDLSTSIAPSNPYHKPKSGVPSESPASLFLNRSCLENRKVKYSKHRQLELRFLPETTGVSAGRAGDVREWGLRARSGTCVYRSGASWGNLGWDLRAGMIKTES